MDDDVPSMLVHAEVKKARHGRRPPQRSTKASITLDDTTFECKVNPWNQSTDQGMLMRDGGASTAASEWKTFETFLLTRSPTVGYVAPQGGSRFHRVDAGRDFTAGKA